MSKGEGDVLATRSIRVRSCVGCRRRGAKETFLRIVRSPGGVLSVDPSGKAPGRGAYICANRTCLAKALKGARLSRALRISLDETVVSELQQLLPQ